MTVRKKTIRRLLVVAVVAVIVAVLNSGGAGAQPELPGGGVAGTGTDAQGEQSKQVVLGFYLDVLAANRLDRVRDYLAEDYVQHSPGLPGTVDGYLKTYAQLHDTFPDLLARIDKIVAHGDKVMMLNTFRGTHKQSGRQLDFETAELYRVADGKIVEHWDAVDYAAMDELGVVFPRGEQPSTATNWTGTEQQRQNLGRLFLTIDSLYAHPEAPVRGFLAKDVIQHTRGLGHGLLDFKQNLIGYRERFPDLTMQVTHTVADNDNVVVFWYWKGHEKDTGEELVLNRADVFRVAGGQFVEHWSRIDYRAANPFGLK